MTDEQQLEEKLGVLIRYVLDHKNLEPTQRKKAIERICMIDRELQDIHQRHVKQWNAACERRLSGRSA